MRIYSKDNKIYIYLSNGRYDLYVFIRGALRFICIYLRGAAIYTYLLKGRQDLYVLLKDDRIYTCLLEGRQDLYVFITWCCDLYVFIQGATGSIRI